MYPTFSFSIADLRQAGACYLNLRIADINKHYGSVLPEDEQISMLVWWSLPTTSSFSDILWSLRLDKVHGFSVAVDLSVFIARHVLSIFELACPGDNRPRRAIEAVEAWLANKQDTAYITEIRLAVRDVNLVCREVSVAGKAFAAFAAISIFHCANSTLDPDRISDARSVLVWAAAAVSSEMNIIEKLALSYLQGLYGQGKFAH